MPEVVFIVASDEMASDIVETANTEAAVVEVNSSPKVEDFDAITKAEVKAAVPKVDGPPNFGEPEADI